MRALLVEQFGDTESLRVGELLRTVRNVPC